MNTVGNNQTLKVSKQRVLGRAEQPFMADAPYAEFFVKQFTRPHTPETFRTLFRLFGSRYRDAEVPIRLNQSIGDICQSIVDIVLNRLVNDHLHPLMALIKDPSFPDDRTSLLRGVTNEDDLGKYILLCWFRDAIVDRTVPSPKDNGNRNNVFNGYIRSVRARFPMINRSMGRNNVIGYALVALKTELGQCSVENLHVTAGRMGVVLGTNGSEIADGFVRMLRITWSNFNDTAAIDDVVKSVYDKFMRKPGWTYMLRKIKLHKYPTIKTEDLDLVVLRDPKIRLDAELDATTICGRIRNALKSHDLSITSQKQSTILFRPIPESYRSARNNVVRRIWTIIGFTEPFPFNRR